MKKGQHRIKPQNTNRMKSNMRQWKGKKKNKSCIFLCARHSIFPVLCAYSHLGFGTDVSGKLGRGQGLSTLGAVGKGSRVRGSGLSEGVPTALHMTAAEQLTQNTKENEHATRRDPHSCVP